MATLAPKLPVLHPFAGGYPGRGGQYVPTDADASDYLSRLAEADGASVEVGIAQAIEAFITGCKADNAGYSGDATRTNWDAIQASCIMCGARTLSGALVPLKGDAPTSYNFVEADYSRSGTPGLKGDGSTKYLDTGRAGDADGEDDYHQAVYETSGPTSFSNYPAYIGNNSAHIGVLTTGVTLYVRSRFSPSYDAVSYVAGGLLGVSREEASSYTFRAGETSQSFSRTSDTVNTQNQFVFAFASGASAASSLTDARIAFYSVGAALDLAKMDTRVTNLINGIKFHSLTGLLPNDYDPDTIAYIVSGIEAGGTL